ncbi:MAG TPA: hypothetical protein VF482_09785 [Trebonia sp.]
MNKATVARVLGVAEHEVLDVVHRAEGWFALHHDMASHDESWRPVTPPGDAQAPTEPAAEPEQADTEPEQAGEPSADPAQAPTDAAPADPPARAARRARS